MPKMIPKREFKCRHSGQTWVMGMNLGQGDINSLIYVHLILRLVHRRMIY